MSDESARNNQPCSSTDGETQYVQERSATEGCGPGSCSNNVIQSEKNDIIAVHSIAEDVLDLGKDTVELIIERYLNDDKFTRDDESDFPKDSYDVNPLAALSQNNVNFKFHTINGGTADNISSVSEDTDRMASYSEGVAILHALIPVVTQPPYPSKSCNTVVQTQEKTYPQHKRKSLCTGYQRCDICGIMVKLRDMLVHSRAHVGDFVLPCPNAPKCPYIFCHSGPIAGHLRTGCKFNKRTIDDEDGDSPSSFIKKIKYTCETCGFESDTRLVFRTHLEMIHERVSSKTHTCPVVGCGTLFSVRQSVDFHLGIHDFHAVTTQKCDICGKTIPVHVMKQHLTDVHEKMGLLSCHFCPFIFPERVTLVQRMFKHRRLNLFCDICGDDVIYPRHCDLLHHFAVKHKVEFPRFICKACGKEFPTKIALCKHIKRMSHFNETILTSTAEENKTTKTKYSRRYICDDCVKPVSFKRMAILTSHKIRVHGLKPLECTICGQQFVSKQTMILHNRREHERLREENRVGVPEYMGICDSEQTLTSNLRTTHMMKKFECCSCEKTFHTETLLKEHKAKFHLGTRSLLCELCGKRCGNKSILTSHKLIHLGARPFECTFCGQKFRQKWALKRHTIAHTNKGDQFKPRGPMKKNN